MVQYSQINKCDAPHKIKDKNQMIMSIDAEKTSDKIQYPFMIKNTQQSGNSRSIPQHNKDHI